VSDSFDGFGRFDRLGRSGTSRLDGPKRHDDLGLNRGRLI